MVEELREQGTQTPARGLAAVAEDMSKVYKDVDGVVPVVDPAWISAGVAQLPPIGAVTGWKVRLPVLPSNPHRSIDKSFLVPLNRPTSAAGRKLLKRWRPDHDWLRSPLGDPRVFDPAPPPKTLARFVEQMFSSIGRIATIRPALGQVLLWRPDHDSNMGPPD